MRILFFILTCFVLVSTKIIIEDANIAAISHDDIGMIFFVALHNTDNCAYRIFTRMVKCVEEVDLNDKDCEMMQLLGGDMGEIKPKCYKNITLLYPNMYLLNRKGYCIIAIKFISEDNQVLEKKTNVSFNTYLNNKNNKKVSPVLGYFDGTYTVCESVDLDPTQNCVPVDCHMKYLGTRSYFNKKWKRCQKVPVCVYDVDKELPDVGYTPITNKCIDLERCIKKTDLQPLDNKYAELSDGNSYSLMLTAINCHYGRLNNASGLCECNPGWISASFDKEPTLFPIHMCNIELSSWYDSNRTEITFVAFIISVVAVAVAMVVVLMSFILYHLYKCLRGMDVKTECYCDLESGMDKKKKDKKPKKSSLKESAESLGKIRKSQDSLPTTEQDGSQVSKALLEEGRPSTENVPPSIDEVFVESPIATDSKNDVVHVESTIKPSTENKESQNEIEKHSKKKKNKDKSKESEEKVKVESKEKVKAGSKEKVEEKNKKEEKHKRKEKSKRASENNLNQSKANSSTTSLKTPQSETTNKN